MSRTICWFSHGATSAIATWLTIKKNPSAEIVNCETNSEHPDNARFLADCERLLFGRKVTIIKSDEFADVDAVIEKTRYMSGPKGARCTGELKRKPRLKFQRCDDIHVFGYHSEEKTRLGDFLENNPELTVQAPLIDAGLNHEDCEALLRELGIKPPAMYQLGYTNNNCLGCLKATSPRYWNMIRRDFPEVFEKRCQQSRELGVKLVKLKQKRIFLDDLPPDEWSGTYGSNGESSCSLFCEIALNV